MQMFFSVMLLGLTAGCTSPAVDDGFIPIFNGKDLSGWTPAKEHPDSFSVKDGVLVANGGRSHLFYTGDVNGGTFKNFRLRMDVKTFPDANGGVYFHTEYQDEGWPEKGYECQVNTSHRNLIKTGSLFGVVNIIVPEPGKKAPMEGINIFRDASPSTDGEWFTYDIVVSGSEITTLVNGETMVEYKEPEGGPKHPKFKDRKLSEGTFAIQGHDPDSEVHYRNIRVKVLD
jgi:hypothetical protein